VAEILKPRGFKERGRVHLVEAARRGRSPPMMMRSYIFLKNGVFRVKNVVWLCKTDIKPKWVLNAKIFQTPWL